jgi:HAE1 family hydrophobic/amphiphilic exporter-1
VQLERSSGVGEVRIIGGLERTINVWVDAERLAAYQIPITAVRDAVVRQNAEVPGGRVTASVQEQTLRTMSRLTDPSAFNDLVIATLNGAPIRVRDIGWAEDGTREQRSVARLNGAPTVTLEVRRQSGANTVEVIKAAKRKLARIATQLPSDVTLEVIRDQSRYIYAALHEITLHLIFGSLLACLVVLLFMRSWRSTLIASVAIPASVISSFGVMWALDFTLNSVTMLALVLMVGIVIDDAIIVLENIFRHVEEKKLHPFEAARTATAEIGLAVMATTLSLAVIFLPVSFMSSISGRFLYQFGITAAAAIMVSLLVSFTLTPVMSARLLREEDAPTEGSLGEARSRTGFYTWLDHGYAATLAFAMRHRALVAFVAFGVMLSSVLLYALVRQEYIPSDVDDESAYRLYHQHFWSRPGIGADLHRVRLGIRTLDYFHVHDSRLTIRELGASVDYFALFAAVGAVRIVLVMGDGEHAKPLLSTWPPCPLRRGEEKCHPANRPYESTTRARHGPVVRHHAG